MGSQLNVNPRLDFHNHLIPAVDDGAANVDESLGGIRAMAAQGIARIITTPHIRASILERTDEAALYLDAVAKSWGTLSERAAHEMPEVQLSRGFEILLDLPLVQLSDPVLRLAESRFVLVEFPFLSVPPNSSRALEAIGTQGYEPIVAHPERYRDAQERIAIVREWLAAGARLQLNAGSFLGRYGPKAEKAAWALLGLGAAHYVCSDYHATGVCDTDAAYQAVMERSDHGTAELLFSINPGRIPGSQSPLPVGPIPAKKRGRLEKLIRWHKS